MPTATITLFTTGQVAKLLCCAPRTVSKWIDSGHLIGFRLPGSQDRRVYRPRLVEFLKRNGMPTIEELEESGRAS